MGWRGSDSPTTTLNNGHRLVEALELHGAHGLHGRHVREPLDHLLGQHDLALAGLAAQAAAEVHGVPDDVVLAAPATTDVRGDHRPRVHPDAELHRRDVEVGQLGVQLGCPALDFHRAVERRLCVVLAREGRAEHREDLIAHELEHGAVVAVDDLGQQVVEVVEHGPHLAAARASPTAT